MSEDPEPEERQPHEWFPKLGRGWKCMRCGYWPTTKEEKDEADDDGCEPGT